MTVNKTKANVASSKKPFSPLEASFDNWLHSHGNRGGVHQVSILMFPNLQPRSTGDQAYDHWDSEVLVCSSWQPDKLHRTMDKDGCHARIA